jgi:hypothetical protein
MFQPAAVTVKAGLVQSPRDCVGPSSRCAGVGAAVGTVVVLAPPPDDAVVDFFGPAGVVVIVGEVPSVPPLAVVVVAEPLGVGSLYAPPPEPPFEDWEAPTV